MAWTDFENVNVSYKQLIEDNDVITRDNPVRGTLMEQIQFVEKIAPKGKCFRDIRKLLAIIKYNVDFPDLIASASLKIKALCRNYSGAHDHAQELIRGRVCVYFLAALDSSEGSQEIGPGFKEKPSNWNTRLLECISEAVHSLSFNVERGTFLEWFDLTIQGEFLERIINEMKRHPDNLSLNISGAWTMLNLCYLHKANQRKIVEMKGVQLVVDAMKRWSNDVQMQEKGCGLIRNMADLGQHEHAQLDSRALNQVLQALDFFQKETIVVANSIGALRNLAFNAASRDQIGKLGGLKQILTAMENHSHSDLVQEFGLETIWNLCTHPDFRSRFVNTCVVNIVKNAIRIHKWDARIATEALQSISYMALDDDLRSQLLDQDIPKIVVDMLSRFLNVLNVQEKGLRGLLVFSQYEVCHKRLLKHRVVGRVLQAMKEHSLVNRLQQDALGIFLNLSLRCEIATKIIDKGGVVRILKIMDLHHDDVVIQQRGCGVLSLLSAIPDNDRRALIAKKGAIVTAIVAMSAHRSVKLVQQYGCDVFANLALNGYSQIQIPIRGGIDQIVQCMKSFSNDIGVMERACAALWNLSVTVRNQEKILASGAVTLLFECLRDHIEHENLQYNCCGALRNLSLLAAIRDELRSLNVFPHIVASMKKHSISLSLQQEACGAVVHLCLTPINRKLFTQADIFTCIRNAMQVHESDYRLQNHCIGALLNLTLDDDNKIKILEHTDTVKAVLNVMRRYPTWEIIQERSIRILLHCSTRGQ